MLVAFQTRILDKRSDLQSKIKEVLNFSGPVLVEVICKKQDKVFPIVPAGAGIDEMILE